MTFHPPAPWKFFKVIQWGDQEYHIYSVVCHESDFLNHKRFMLGFPDGKKCMLHLACTVEAVEDYEGFFGKEAYAKAVEEAVTAAAIKEIEAAVKAHSLPSVSPNVKLVPLDMEPPIVAGGDFAKVESEMMAHLLTKVGLPSEHIYGTPPITSAASLAKTKAVMDDVFKGMAAKYAMNPINPAYFGKGTIVLDSLAGMTKEDAFKVLYGGMPEPKLQVTEKGLATLKKFGVALAG